LFRQQCDADTADRSLKSHVQITRDKPRLQLDMLRSIITICQVPSRPTVEYIVGAGDRVEFGQVSRMFRVPIVVKKGRTDDQHALGMAESFRYQSRHVLYDGFCPDRDVKSFLNHVYGPVRRLDEDRNVWMDRHVAGEGMSQTPLRQQDRAAEANEPCRFPAQFRHAVIGRLRSLDRRNTSLKKALTSFCESQSPADQLL